MLYRKWLEARAVELGVGVSQNRKVWLVDNFNHGEKQETDKENVKVAGLNLSSQNKNDWSDQNSAEPVHFAPITLKSVT